MDLTLKKIRIISQETKDKIAKSHIGLRPSEESKEKNRQAHLGKYHTEEAKKKISKNSALFWKGKFLSKEHIKKLSESHKGQTPWNKGLTKETDERVKKCAQTCLGKIISEETRKKISEAEKGINHWNYGKHLSEETRKKIGEAQKGRTFEEIYGEEKAQELKKKMSLNRKGKPVPKEKREIYVKNVLVAGKKTRFKKGLVPWNKGRPMDIKSKKKMMDSMKLTFSKPELIKRLKEKRALQITPFQDTKIEVKIQDFLKKLGIDFFTHQYISEITHSYQCDILINPQLKFMIQKKMIIEIDGDYWHGNPIKFPNPNEWQREQIEEDYVRTKELRNAGFEVIRLWETEINKMQFDEFKEILYKSLNITEQNKREL